MKIELNNGLIIENLECYADFRDSDKQDIVVNNYDLIKEWCDYDEENWPCSLDFKSVIGEMFYVRNLKINDIKTIDGHSRKYYKKIELNSI